MVKVTIADRNVRLPMVKVTGKAVFNSQRTRIDRGLIPLRCPSRENRERRERKGGFQSRGVAVRASVVPRSEAHESFM